MKLAFAAIIKPTNEEAELLSQLLANVSPHVDGLFITFAGERNNKRCEEVAEMFGAVTSFYKWDKDFAAARSFNFAQVPKDFDFILWGDADDQFRGLYKLRKTIEDNPEVDVFFMNYLYWFDEWHNPTVVHVKEQVVRNDGSTEWTALLLHEGLSPKRMVEKKFIEGIERMHFSSEERTEKAKIRNVDISKEAIKRFPKDPRAYWNYAQSLRGSGKNKEAIKTYEKFLPMSRSDDEKYMARVYMAECQWMNMNYAEALDSINYAIGLRTETPDAYHMKGHILFSIKRFEEARDAYITGLTKVTKIDYNTLLVYNPREYDYVPLMNLAKTYINLSQPGQALTCIKSASQVLPDNKSLDVTIKELEKEKVIEDRAMSWLSKLQKTKTEESFFKLYERIPGKIKMYPKICVERNVRFIKKESSGKDLVFYLGFTEEAWTPESVKKTGIGGSEEAVIHLARGLVKKGWNVSVYNNCGYKEQIFDGVKYVPFWAWNYRDRQDAVVLWRNPRPVTTAQGGINTDKLYIDLHDVIPEAELLNRYDKVDKIFVKSNAQRGLFPNIPDDKFAVIPNGVDLTPFDIEVERDPYLLINLSSPDRSLESCLDILDKVRERVSPELKKKIKFAWYYGWGVFDAVITDTEGQNWKQSILKRFEKGKKEGWIEGGMRISHDKVAELNLRAGAYIYPTNFFEIDFIGGTKAQIAGCLPIMTDFAALDEKIQYGVKVRASKTRDNWDKKEGFSFGLHDKIEQDIFINLLCQYLETADEYEGERKVMSRWAKKKYNWDVITEQWDSVLKGEDNN